MATINLSPLQASPSLPLLYSTPAQASAKLSFNSPIAKLSTSFLSLSFRPSSRTTPRRRASFAAASAAHKSLSEAELLPVPPSLEEIVAKFPSECGVYAIHDKNGDLQFVGITKNLAASVATHSKSVPDLCSAVKVGVVEEADRDSLTKAWKSWMEEHIKATGKIPPGNENGNATWVKQPPAKKKKADLRLTPGRHVQLTVPLEDLIDRLVKENRVVAFIKGSRSAPMCGFSQKVVGILESQGVDYESVDVLDEEYNSGLRETLKKYSNWPTFPQIFVQGELLGGCDILTSMYETGELAGLLKK
ncbi:unnamed protein product [Linum trigynum]|uniref:Glutaredoxin domain-containing protein n=1 Tax=Linum trigynum TaxID=586398 RepID=A0AAV2DYG7_9ROSI